MAKVFVTGTNGLVGSFVVDRLLKEGYEVFASSRTGDLSSFNQNPRYRFIQVNFADPYSLGDAFEFVRPELVVHCGAMSKPDDCEQRQPDAFDANVYGTVQLLKTAELYNAFFVQVSTDFVFSGDTGMYREADRPNPVNYYGKTKWQAEEAVAEYQSGWAIARTCFVFAKPFYGRGNFITLVAQKLRQGEPFNIVEDQQRTPTYAPDLAWGIARILERRSTGIFHLAGKEKLSPYTMALKVADHLNITNHRLRPVTRAEFKEPAPRPLCTGLNIEKAIQELSFNPLSFDKGLEATLS